MSQCYNCRYFRSSEGKCGYNGYSRSSSSECTIAEHRPYGDRVCGNCKSFRPEEKRCIETGNRKDPWESCGIYKHQQA